MNLVPTWPIAVGTLVIGLALGAGGDHLVMAPKVAAAQKKYDTLVLADKEQERQRQLQRAEDDRAARTKEQAQVARIGQIEQEKQDAIALNAGRYAAALARLQNRPDRKPAGTGGVPEASPACQGATGADLSRQDAGVALGEAARADGLRSALAACYQAYDAVSK